jgi:hypothetical protein
MAVWLFLRAPALSAPPREGCLAVPLVPALQDCVRKVPLLPVADFLGAPAGNFVAKHGNRVATGSAIGRMYPKG